MSMRHCLVPHQSIYRLSILDISAVNGFILLAACVRRTANHDTNVFLLIDFTSQLFSHYFVYNGNKVITAFIVCICRAYVQAIFLLEGKNWLKLGERQFLFGN